MQNETRYWSNKCKHVISNLSIQWSVPTTYDDIMYILLHLHLYTNSLVYTIVDIFVFVWYHIYLHLQDRALILGCIDKFPIYSLLREYCVLISSAVVTTTNSTTTFICSEDAPRKNVHCIHIYIHSHLQIWEFCLNDAMLM